MSDKKLGWIFHTDGFEGIPYVECPYCHRKVNGKTVKFAPLSLLNCPECGKEVHFDNITEDDLNMIDLYFGDNQ